MAQTTNNTFKHSPNKQKCTAFSVVFLNKRKSVVLLSKRKSVVLFKQTKVCGPFKQTTTQLHPSRLLAQAGKAICPSSLTLQLCTSVLDCMKAAVATHVLNVRVLDTPHEAQLGCMRAAIPTHVLNVRVLNTTTQGTARLYESRSSYTRAERARARHHHTRHS
jgi:hypothetical protein